MIVRARDIHALSGDSAIIVRSHVPVDGILSLAPSGQKNNNLRILTPKSKVAERNLWNNLV